MPVSNSEAVAQRPSFEEQAAIFKGLSTQDGEIADGKARSQADERAAAEARENAAAEANKRSHAENQAAGTTSTDGAKEPPAAKVELTEDEEQEALQEATDKKGAVLTDEEADAVVAKALTAKEKQAKKPQPDPAEAEKHFKRREARRNANLARENEDLRNRIAALERGEKPAALTNDTQAAKTTPKDGKPDPTDTAKYQYGELDAQYLADLSAWAAREAIRQERESEKTQKLTQEEQAAANALKARVTAFEEAGMDQYDDFQEVVVDAIKRNRTEPGHFPMSETLGEMILESDHGQAIIYELASDLKEARRIAELSPARQAAWFVRKEDEISAGSARRTDENERDNDPPPAEARRTRQLPQPRTNQARESKAPRPLPNQRQVNGGGGNRVPSAATTDFAAFEALAMGGKK